MAGRNIKNNADYFSHDADASSDEKVVYLESLFGHTGYAVYFKMLECMTRSDGFMLEWDDIKKSIYAAKFGISVTEIDQIIEECCREEIKAFEIDNGYIYSPGLIKRMQPLIEKRQNNREKYQQKKQHDKDENISEAEITQNVTKKPQRKGKERKEYTEEFERFWSAYPKKVGKGGAYKAWQKIKSTRPTIEDIERILEQQRNSVEWTKEGGRYIPNPQTWLNQARWEDQLTPLQSSFSQKRPDYVQ
jgi:hypothetical protein